VRALTEANGTLCPEITKNLLKIAPKILLQFYEQEREEFSICITTRPQPRTTGKMASRTHCKDQALRMQTNRLQLAAFMAMV
jgi:hypothetical protein